MIVVEPYFIIESDAARLPAEVACIGSVTSHRAAT
jgi:hypothetical protein